MSDTAATAASVWREPVHGGHVPREAFQLSGIEQLRLFLSARVARPPISYLTGMRPTEIGVGTSTFVMPITDWLLTPQGIVAGGEVAILADGPLGCAVQSVLPPRTAYATSEISISMVRPVPRSGTLVARGRMVHGGRQLALSEVFVTDDAGRLIAHGTSRCVVFPSKPGGDGPPPELPPVQHAVEEGWQPPYERLAPGSVLAQEVWDARSGLDILRAQIAGELPDPPVYHLLGMRPVAVDEGTATFTVPATGWLTSPLGSVEGGVTACLADFALACAVQTTVPAGTAYAPTDLRVQFLRPVMPDGADVIARATVVHRGRGVAIARADVTRSDGKLVATATGSAIILPGRRVDLADSSALG